MEKPRVLIMGAAGRDFHNFNVVYRNNPNFEVVANASLIFADGFESGDLSRWMGAR